MLRELNERSIEVFKNIVEHYVNTGDPVASKSLSEGMNLSSATIRNVMSDLEQRGFLYSPHTSAGRIPTNEGLRFFINGLLEVGDLEESERQSLSMSCQSRGRSFENVLEDVTSTLSGLSRCAGLVLAPKTEAILKHIEFVKLSDSRVLVIMVTEDGMVENRIIETSLNLNASSLTEATNFLSSYLSGKTLSEAKKQILGELDANRSDLDVLSSKVIEEGLAVWTEDANGPALIVRGQSYLLNDVKRVEELEKLRELFDVFDTRKELLSLLESVTNAEGVQIFIGSENKLFSNSGCSVIVSPYKNQNGRVIGALGVVGPTRINYSRIIPMVDFTAKLIGRSLL